MASRSIVCVEDCRPSVPTVALLHPLNSVPLCGVGLVLLLAGALVPLGLLLVVDALVLLLALRLPALRRRFGALAVQRARRRAAERLGQPERAEWESLRALVLRTQPLQSRRAEVEGLLTTYINVALALTRARQSLDATEAVELTRRESSRDDEAQAALTRYRASSAERATRAIAALQAQLATSGHLIRLACEEAGAAHCEAAAGMWSLEIDEAARAAQLERA